MYSPNGTGRPIMSIPILDITQALLTPASSLGKYSHPIHLVRFYPYSTCYVSKEMHDASEAQNELIAQEFFRLIIPEQPVTRLAEHPSHHTHFIISEVVPGFRKIPRYSNSMFADNVFSGLGLVMLVALFVHEVDFKNSNVGLNEQNQAIKIDGDWCFACLNHKNKYRQSAKKISTRSLDALPAPLEYDAHNWLNFIEESTVRDAADHRLVDHSLSTASPFRQEINRATLKILLLPNSYIRSFVEQCNPYSIPIDRYVNFLTERREELKAAALANKSFNQYFNSQDAKETIRAHWLHLTTFCVGSYLDNLVIKKQDQPQFKIEYLKKREELRSLLSVSEIEVDNREGRRMSVSAYHCYNIVSFCTNALSFFANPINYASDLLERKQREAEMKHQQSRSR